MFCSLKSLLVVSAVALFVVLVSCDRKCVELQTEEDENIEYPKDFPIVDKLNCEASIHFDKELVGEADTMDACWEACGEKRYSKGQPFETNYEDKVACCCSDHVWADGLSL